MWLCVYVSWLSVSIWVSVWVTLCTFATFQKGIPSVFLWYWRSLPLTLHGPRCFVLVSVSVCVSVSVRVCVWRWVWVWVCLSVSDIQTYRHKHRDTDTQRATHIEKHTQRQRDTQIHRHKDKHTPTHTQRQTKRHRQREAHTPTQRQKWQKHSKDRDKDWAPCQPQLPPPSSSDRSATHDCAQHDVNNKLTDTLKHKSSSLGERINKWLGMINVHNKIVRSVPMVIPLLTSVPVFPTKDVYSSSPMPPCWI